MFIASVCLFICCERDDAELDHTLNWKAETIVDEKGSCRNRVIQLV